MGASRTVVSARSGAFKPRSSETSFEVLDF